jgi:hypothetical protein
LTAWTVHDIRRLVATGLQRLGTSLQTIEAVLGHVSGSRRGVVGIYQRHSFDAEKRAALEAWGAGVMALLEDNKADKVVAMRNVSRWTRTRLPPSSLQIWRGLGAKPGAIICKIRRVLPAEQESTLGADAAQILDLPNRSCDHGREQRGDVRVPFLNWRHSFPLVGGGAE